MFKGIHIELIAPTLPTLAANVNVHYSGMGSVLASRGAGFLVANILGAILQNIVKKHSSGILMCGFILPAVGETVLCVKRKISICFCFSDFCYSIYHINNIVMCFILSSGRWSRIDRLE